MRLIELEQKLLSLNQPILMTRDVAACLNIPKAQASKILERLVVAGRFFKLMRGKWAVNKNIDPLILPEYLTMPYPSYISLQTALYYHGMISQIPFTIYAVTLARTQKILTPFGTISLHHIQANFFFGFDMVGDVKIAIPEKALVDVLYLTPTKSNLFKSLPELELGRSFDFKLAESFVAKIISPRIKTIVAKRLKELSRN